MAYNIQFQICGFIMVSMVMFFYFSNKSLRLATEKVYSYLMVAVAGCLTLDIFAVIVLNLKDSLPQIIVDMVNKAYTFSICLVAFFTRVYVFVNINGKKISKKYKIYFFSLLMVGVLGIIVLPIQSVVNATQVYTYGPVVNLTYVIVTIYLLASVAATMRYRKSMNQKHFIAINFLLFSWILTAILQFIKNEWLLVGFAMAAAMVFMYFCLENPFHNLDSRTEVFNQQAFQLYLKELFFYNKDFVLLLLDLGDMGFVTETFGVENTDILIRDMAQFLDKKFPGKVFRTSEYRFTLVFDKEIEKVSQHVEIIKNKFEKPWLIENIEYVANIYMVQMRSSECDLSTDKVTEFSRHFLAEIKGQGKNTFLKVSKEQAIQKEEHTLIEKAIRHAITNREIQVFYQPIYSFEEKKFISAEALTRIKDFDGEYINPELFIRIAEQNGMILELGMLIFEEVCRFIHDNSLKEKGIQYIEINLSVVQCIQEKLADELILMMKKYDVPPSFINLEITETAAIKSDMILKRNMHKLMEQGVSFSLDDYGNGYSNLAYVMDLPVKIIKLDKSMIQAYCDTEKVRVAMEFTVLMIKKLNIQVVVEGVETEEQLEQMRKLNIDFIQGFYFSKPLEKNEFRKRLELGVS